jgi:N-acetyl sugar amidotransferase
MSYRECSKCVMDTTAKEITFDSEGVCSFCHQAQKALKEKGGVIPDMKSKGKYDVIIGLSGGIDSSYALTKIVELGLRPLCFSVDNGWNDPKADENIMKLVEGLKVPFFRYTIDLDKFKELQGAFLRAGVKNIEIPSDHIIVATAYEMASKYGIKWIVSGGNVETESIMPFSWGYNARDLVHIKDIYKKMTGKKLKGLPTMSLLKFNYYRWIKKIKVINLLDYYNYNRKEAIFELTDKFGYKDYGAKHEESVWTSWFQNFYLFEKWNIDKRKAHLSSLINSGQMTRQEAVQELQKCPVYPKMGIEEKVMKYPKHEYTDYATDEKLYNFICKVVRKFV